jgi:mono/diheme cytochrome c family protein
MIKLIRLICICLALTSCNSDKKKTASYAVNQESFNLEKSIKRGEQIYTDMCITCHLPNGKGVPKAFPPLTDSDYLRNKQTESIKAVKNGMSGKIVVNGITYNSVMSPLGLSDEEVADVMNYINNSWGNKIKNIVTPEKVSKL